MAIKELKKVPNQKPIQVDAQETEVDKFISKGGTLATMPKESDDDHRLTLRIPKWLMDKVDAKRKDRVGKISRNLWILEVLEKAAK
jgi:hypothetical protein